MDHWFPFDSMSMGGCSLFFDQKNGSNRFDPLYRIYLCVRKNEAVFKRGGLCPVLVTEADRILSRGTVYFVGDILIIMYLNRNPPPVKS